MRAPEHHVAKEVTGMQKKGGMALKPGAREKAVVTKAWVAPLQTRDEGPFPGQGPVLV